MVKRLVRAGVALVLLAGATTLLWAALSWPPPRLILRYGLLPAGGPTGRTMTVHGVEFVELSAGYFRMGSEEGVGAVRGDLLGLVCRPLGLPWGKQPSLGAEGPPHWVAIPEAFWIARTEVTHSQYLRFLAESPSVVLPERMLAIMRSLPRYAMGFLSQLEAKEYCEWAGFRLPSEAEWEYACRAGTTTRFSFGDDEERLAQHACHFRSSSSHSREVGGLRANPWGLLDMHGGVWEHCEDSWHIDYEGAPTDGSAWEPKGSKVAVVRGGSWSSTVQELRSAHRRRTPMRSVGGSSGLRPVYPARE